MRFTRKTLREELHFEGRGLHSGVPVRVRVIPSSEGIRFRFGNEVWEAKPANVTDTTRCTRLGGVSTIEHLMSALAGAEITDVEVELSAPEMPALDGSARVYFDALKAIATENLGEREMPSLFTRLFFHENVVKVAVGAGEGHWRYLFDTGAAWPGVQEVDFFLHEAYGEQVSGARTFGFERELPAIRAAGLAQGLDETSALVLGENGYVNAPRFQDEPARHKLLDAVGDLYLAGVPIRFLNVVCERSGHSAHVKAAQMLYEACHG